MGLLCANKPSLLTAGPLNHLSCQGDTSVSAAFIDSVLPAILQPPAVRFFNTCCPGPLTVQMLYCNSSGRAGWGS